jgi:peptide/nickel transport system ATP-binding protein
MDADVAECDPEVMAVMGIVPRAARPLLEVTDLTVRYPGLTGALRGRCSVEAVNLVLRPGESVGVVGAAGAGKSTVARVLTGQLAPARGQITFAGRELLGCSGRSAHRRRRGMRLVVGDGYAALPPQRRIGALLTAELDPLRRMDPGFVLDALELAGLTPARRYLRCYPHQLTRCERQRVAFARALVTEPRLLLADEPVGLRDELIELYRQLRLRYGVAVLHLTHDLDLARRCCDRLVVLRGGRVVEHGPTEQIVAHPAHPYTAAWVSGAAA